MKSMSDNDEQYCFNIKMATQDYRENRKCLIDVQTKTRAAYLKLVDILKPSTAELLECININDLSEALVDFGIIPNQQLPNDKNVPDVEKNVSCNPAIAIVGQVKAAKSTLINVLLRKTIVCQAYSRCTARITRLTYSKENYVELLDCNGVLLERKLLKTHKIPARFMKLNENDRSNIIEIQKEVKAGINCEFLSNGIDLIDTPGLSEHSLLSNLSKEMVKNILPIMIYVIDGNTSVKQTDVSDLLELKNTLPDLKIIYFISKLDSDISTDQSNDPEEIEKMKIELSKEKLSIAFRKLQYQNFIPKTYNHWSECPYFHGASLYNIVDYFNHQRSREILFNMELFKRFENELSRFLLVHFESVITTAANSLIYFQMDVLTKIINRGIKIKDSSEEYQNQIERIKRFEEELFENIKNVLSSQKLDLMEILEKKLKTESDVIYQLVQDCEYPSSIRIPDSGITIDYNSISLCQKFIIDIICLGLEQLIERFVEDELFSKYLIKVENHLNDKLERKSSKFSGRNPYDMCLKKILTENYKYNFKVTPRNLENVRSISKLINIICSTIKSFFFGIFEIKTSKGCKDVKSQKWKKHQVNNYLKHCDFSQLANCVCTNLIENFQQCHEAFNTALEIEKKFFQKSFQISDNIRQCLKKHWPEFSVLLMETLDIKGRYMIKDVQIHETIGQGSQGSVYRCTMNGKELACKTRNVNAEKLNEISDEVYYSYLFEHRHLLPFIAISIKTQKYFSQVSIFTPLMKSDVFNFIKENEISLEKRLIIALQTAEALQYLHKQNIMHRDLKLANILDISNILSLKVSIPNLNIIYFITRLDTDESSELIENDQIKTAKHKLEFTFRKLQKSNLIPKTFTDYSECHNFHGASLYSYMDYCKKIQSPETDFHNSQFCKFESDLNCILSENFETDILTATRSLIGFQMDVLTKIISRAKQFVDFTNENLDEIFIMRKVEERIHNELKSAINNSKTLLIDRLITRLANESDLITELIADAEFPKSIIKPENKAFIKKQAKACQNHIINLICQDLDNLIDNFVQDELNKNFEKCFEAYLSPKIINKLKSYSGRLSSKSAYRLCLERNLTKHYKYDLLGLKIKNPSFSILKFMKKMIIGLFRSDLSDETFDMNSRHWRIGQTRAILNFCDRNLLAENICDNMLNDLEMKHERFLMNLEKEFKVIQKEIRLSETIRDKISNETSSFTLLLMKTLDIRSKYLMKDSVEKEIIGRGSQGTVFRCVCNGKEYAKKKLIVPSDFLESISEEVYYSYLFEHPNLLPLIAVTINEGVKFDCIEISMYTPLMKTDLENYMKNNKITLEEQLRISLEVAEALKYIHSQNIMHRDLKLANILLDDENNVYLADYGFCKSLALSNYSFVGTFVNIAPEIVSQSKYDQKIDIYSFGMLLWYLAKGNCEPPLFANYHSTTVKVLMEVTNNNMRPERLENISDRLWDLINGCWDKNPLNRPDINSIISTLRDLLSDFSMKK